MKDLSLKILLALSRRARSDGVERLRSILDRTDPKDLSLRRYLLELSADQEGRLREMERYDLRVEGPVSWRPDEAKTKRLLRRFFPSVSQRLGDSPVNREAAMHFVERLEVEITRFYQAIASRAPDDDSRIFFSKEVESATSRLKVHREVLL
jgi:hypothetical protein